MPVGAGKRKRKFPGKDSEHSEEDVSGSTAAAAAEAAVMQQTPQHPIALPYQHPQLLHPAHGIPQPLYGGLPTTVPVSAAPHKLGAPPDLPPNFFLSSLLRPPFQGGPHPPAIPQAITPSAAGWTSSDPRMQMDKSPADSAFVKPDSVLGASSQASDRATANPALPAAFSKLPQPPHSSISPEKKLCAPAAKADSLSPTHAAAASHARSSAPAQAASSIYEPVAQSALPLQAAMPSDWPTAIQQQAQDGSLALGSLAGQDHQQQQVSPGGLTSAHQGFQPFAASAAGSGPFGGAKGGEATKPGPQDWISMAAAAGQQQVPAFLQTCMASPGFSADKLNATGTNLYSVSMISVAHAHASQAADCLTPKGIDM